MTTWEEWFDVQNAADVTGLESYTEKERRLIYTPREQATYVHFDALYQAYLNACLILLARKTPFAPGIPFQETDDRDHQQGFAHFGGPQYVFKSLMYTADVVQKYQRHAALRQKHWVRFLNLKRW